MAQVKFPEAAIALAYCPAEQSDGFDAKAVAVDALPVRFAVMVDAVKLPELSLATIALFVLADVAVVAAFPTELQVKSPFAAIVVANWFEPQSAGFAANAVAVEEFPVTAATTPSEKVFAPAKVCAPVETRPRAEPDAFGMLNVWADPLEEIAKSLPDVPVAKVWVVPVSVLSVVMPLPAPPPEGPKSLGPLPWLGPNGFARSSGVRRTKPRKRTDHLRVTAPPQSSRRLAPCRR